MFQSKDEQFNQVKAFHRAMDGRTQETPMAFDTETVCHRAGFKLEEIVEWVQASVDSDAALESIVADLHRSLDQALEKVQKKSQPKRSLVGQVDALIDLLYFTYGSFALMGVDPHPIFDIVHAANMGKIFPDGKAHFDPVTHKILKPDGWEEQYAPEGKIATNLSEQSNRKA